MTALSSFTPEQVEKIISLPYRVGLHISYAEDEGGERDDDLEMRALNACLREFSSQSASELNKEIAKAVLAAEDKWSSWEQGVFNIDPLCEKAVSALKAIASEAEVKAYIKMVLDIAGSVAQAYGEFGEEEAPETGFFGKVMGSIVKSVSSLADDDANHPMNISAAEGSAIANIAAALKSAV